MGEHWRNLDSEVYLTNAVRRRMFPAEHLDPEPTWMPTCSGAIELSLADSNPRGNTVFGSEPPLARKAAAVEDDDEEMRMAIEASLREMEKARPSAPQGSEEPEYRVCPDVEHCHQLMS